MATNCRLSLVATGQGRISMVDLGYQRIQDFSANGGFAGTIGGGMVSNPRDVAVGPSGMVYVTDVGTNRVLQFEPV